jgi:hypothetical protein
MPAEHLCRTARGGASRQTVKSLIEWRMALKCLSFHNHDSTPVVQKPRYLKRNDRERGELRGGRRMPNGRALGSVGEGPGVGMDHGKGAGTTEPAPVGPTGDAGGPGPIKPGGAKTPIRPYRCATVTATGREGG